MLDDIDKTIEENYDSILSLIKLNLNTPEILLHNSRPANGHAVTDNRLLAKLVLSRAKVKMKIPGYNLILTSGKPAEEFLARYLGGPLIIFKMPKESPYLNGVICPREGSCVLEINDAYNIITWGQSLDFYPEALRPSIRNVIDSIYARKFELLNKSIRFSYYLSGTGVLGHRLLLWGYQS